MKTIRLSLSIPSSQELDFLRGKLQKISRHLHLMFENTSSSFSQISDAPQTYNSYNRKFKRFMKNSSTVPFIIVGVVLLALLIFGLRKVMTNGQVAGASTNSERVELHKALATQQIAKEFSYPLRDANGKQVSALKFMLKNAELRDQIIIQGKVANTTVGKKVLIVNLDLTNTYTKPVQINSRNYIRLLKNNDKKLYDPKIHNDPVDVQPVSTTNTRVGFTVEDTDQNFILRIGDVTDPSVKIEEINLSSLH